MKWPFGKRESQELSPEQRDQEIAAERVRQSSERFRNWEEDKRLKTYGRSDYFSRSNRDDINDLFLSDLSALTKLPDEISNLDLLEQFSIGRSQSTIMQLINDRTTVCEGATRISRIDLLISAES